MYPPHAWKGILKQMLDEEDRSKLRQIADNLEEAIFERNIALEQSTGDIQERLDLITATEELYRVRIERLGFPDWRQRMKP